MNGGYAIYIDTRYRDEVMGLLEKCGISHVESSKDGFSKISFLGCPGIFTSFEQGGFYMLKGVFDNGNILKPAGKRKKKIADGIPWLDTSANPNGMVYSLIPEHCHGIHDFLRYCPNFIIEPSPKIAVYASAKTVEGNGFYF